MRLYQRRFSPRFGLFLHVVFGLLAPSLITPVAAPPCRAEQVSLTPVNKSGIYRLGDAVGWSVTLSDGAPASHAAYTYTVKKNNQDVIKAGELDLSSRNAKIEVKLDEPAMLYLEIMPPADNGKGVRPIVAGAAIAPDLLKPSAARPADFDAFWASQIKMLETLPESPVLTPADSGKPDIEYATVRMDHIHGTHVYGQIAKPKREGKFPGLVIFQWASPPYPLQKQWVTDRAAEGWLALNIEPHDVFPDRPQAYYDALPDAIKHYESIGNNDRDKSYFLRMYLADYRAVDYMAARPDWDGKTLVVMGTSMGGQQSLCVAGLHPKVTHLIVNVPAGCDTNGPLHGRQASYPFFPVNDPRVKETALYFDAVNFAPRIKATSLVAMGFVDTISAPAGIWAALNQIPGPKEAVPMIDSPHNHLATAQQQRPWTERSTAWLATLVNGEPIRPQKAATPNSAETARTDDHQNMMDQLGIKALRPGANPRNQEIFDESTANRFRDTMPDVLTMSDGTNITTADQWPKRRAEIVEEFEREIYGRIPDHAPKVSWEVTNVSEGETGGIATVTKTLVGHVDSSSCPEITVEIQASFTVPVKSSEPVPTMIAFAPRFGGRFIGPSRRGRPDSTPWTQQAIAHGWGYALLDPGSIQPDNAQGLRSGIIGLTSKGQPRRPDQWGALRAWQWGASRLIDYFAANSDSKVDASKIGIEGLSRYGKAAIVTQAFDDRVAVGLIGSSGAGGVKLYRHIFGETLENLAGGEFYWMAGNIMKYAAADSKFGAKTVADLPVDSHELLALCAPRPCFISYGTVEGGDPKWIDARGSFMAGILATPVYELLGKKGFPTQGNYLSEPLPPVGKLVGGELAWRQHEGGHDVTPNWPAFFDWASNYVHANPASQEKVQSSASRGGDSLHEPRGDQPEPRRDANSQVAHRQLVEKAKKGHIDVYFVGDSITRRWGCSDPQYAELLANWKRNFFGWNAGDFGWGGDTTQNILWRLENGELDGVNPKVVVILAGTNNIGTRPANDAGIAEVTKGIKAIVDTCRRKSPSAIIILTAIFPRNDNIAVMPSIDRINANIANFADGRTVRFLNVNDKLADKRGKLFDGIMGDGLHPTVKGYQVWADGLKPILTEILGPPSKTDESPPPTRDPSLK